MTYSRIGRIRLVAIDVDYTLIGSDMKISGTTKQAINAAVDAGCQITLASGRMHRSVVPFAEELGLDVPLISYDGALVKSAKTQRIYSHRPIPLEDAKEILAHLESLGFHINVYIDDELFVESLNEHARRYMNHVKVVANPVGNLSKFMDRPPTKLLMLAEPEIVDSLLPELERRFGRKAHIVRSLPEYIEFTERDATKGSALELLAGQLGISRDEVMAIGDSDNDISMLSYAGIGVAVGNARDSVKAAADYIADGENGAGVAEAIYRFVLGR